MNGTQTLPLRDIHLPGPVSWWPPAPGWWLLLVLLVLIATALYFVYRRYQRGALTRAALAELARIETHYRQEPDLHRLAIELSALLRRTSISLLDRYSIAALSGPQWLAWLDQQGNTDQFSNGPGRNLLSAPYQASPEFYPDALIKLCRAWLQKVPAQQQKVRRRD